MKRKIFLLLTATVVFVAEAVGQTPVKKYDLKSGIVTYDVIMKVGKTEIKQKMIVYFDDYGIKECKETYKNGKLDESYFSDGRDLIRVYYAQKKAYKQGKPYRGTELRVEWTEFGTEKDRQAGKVKKLAATTVAGKNCEMFESDLVKDTVAVFGGWNKILLYRDVKTKGIQTTQKAVKVEENAAVPPEKFTVPTGFAIE